MQKLKMVFVGRGSLSAELRKKWEDQGIEVTIIYDPKEAKKLIKKEHYHLITFETDRFTSLLSSLASSVTLKDYIERRLFDFIKKFKASEGSNLYYALLREIEKPLITLVLKETGGNQKEAAHILGLNRNTLRKKIKDLKIKID